MHHRKSSWVKGHYRNGTWVSGHFRNDTWVNDNSLHVSSYSSATEMLDAERNFLKRYFKLKSSPFMKDIKYQAIDNKIKKVIMEHLPFLINKKVEENSHSDFISYLEKFIIDNLEDELLKIKDIKKFYTSIKDILLIVYILILCEENPYYRLTYNLNKGDERIPVTGENTKIMMKNIVLENKALLSQYYNQNNWDYLRNKFFEEEVKNKIYNPKMALHILFKKICDENLVKGEIIILSKEEVIEIMRKIVLENKVLLTQYYKQDDWDYLRNNFFEKEVKDKIYNPKIALHVLFKKVCEDEIGK